MMSEATILLIDKDDSGIDECRKVFGEDYQVMLAQGEEEGIEFARQHGPVLILLQADDNASLLAVCQKLKADHKTADIPLIILSESASLDEKILCYEAGVYDFLVKPYLPYEGLARLKLLQKRQEIERQLIAEAEVASKTALAAMAGSSELGQAVRFVERSYDAHDYHELAMQFLSVTSNLNLNCSLYFDSYIGKLFFSSEGEVTPLEQELLTRMHDEPLRFKDFGKRTFINYTRVVLLIKNMPLDEPERYGRYKDLFPAMLGAADSKIKALDIEQALIKQTEDIASSFQQIKDTLGDLSGAFQKNQNMTMDIMREMLQELDFELPGMGLDEDQEQYLVDRVDRGIVEAEELMDQSENLNAALFHISNLLVCLAEQQQQITADVRRSHGHAEGEVIDAGNMDGIELF